MGNKFNKIASMYVTEEEIPWIMVTYKPDPYYKTFKFYEKFQVYSNDSQRMNTLSVIPTATDSVCIESTESGFIESAVTNKLKIKITDENITVKDLVNKLFQQNQPSRANTVLSQSDKVTILYHWLTNQDVKHTTYKLTNDFETVKYQLQKLKDMKNSYASFFALLCSYANIPCVIIQGHVKGVRYDADKYLDDDLIREWNAVLVDGRWKFVDTFWGRVYSGNILTPEPFYLFPDPESLKFTHLPISNAWQLLQQPLTPLEFMKQPILKHRFFTMNMELLSNKYAEIRCENGEQAVAFRLNSNTYYKQRFLCAISQRNAEKQWEFKKLPKSTGQFDFIQTKTYIDGNDEEEEVENLETLFEDEDDDDECLDRSRNVIETLKREKTKVWSQDKATNQSTSAKVDSTSAQETMYSHVYVKVRFPEVGYYKMEIIGRPDKYTDYDFVAIYYVNVLPPLPDWSVYFPSEPITGWGPNQYLRKCGLEAVSHKKGEINCYIPRWLQIKFKILPNAMTKDIKLRYELERTSAVETDEKLDETDGPGDETDGPGVDRDNTAADFTHVLDKEFFTPNKDNVINVKVLIKTKGTYVIRLSAILNETHKGEVIHYRIVAEKDPKEIEMALAMEARAVLDTAIEAKEVVQLTNALKATNSYKAHSLVLERYYFATKLRRRLINLKKALRRIADIDNHIIFNIKGYVHPKQDVVCAIRAMFILLGEPMDNLKEWDSMRTMLKTIGPQSVKLRLDKLDKAAISLRDVQKAREVLGDSDTLGALQQSEDVAAIMTWMESVFMIHNIDIKQGNC